METAGSLLVVDDGEDDRHRLLEHLRSGPHRLEVTTAARCLQQLAKAPPDLVILNLAEPLRLARKLIGYRAELDDAMGVMAVLDRPQVQQVPALLDAGLDDYLLLPVFDLCLLDYSVRRNLTARLRLLEQREQEKELAAANQQLADSLRMLERDQRAGSRVQQNMMPEAPLPVGDVTFNYRIRPSLILSGDFIDYFRLTDDRMLFFIADVSGHGASSAFITVLLKNQLRRVRAQYANGELQDPGAMLDWLNRELLEIRLEHHVTMFLGLLDLAEPSLSYANAAHFPGTILHTEGETRYLHIGGLPLGLSARAEYVNRREALPHRFSLVLVSDGVFEVMDEHSLQGKENRLLSIIDEGNADVDTLFASLGLAGKREIPDDIAVFTITSGV